MKKYIKVEIKGRNFPPKDIDNSVVVFIGKGDMPLGRARYAYNTKEWFNDNFEIETPDFYLIEEQEQSSQEELRGELIRFAQQFYSDEETCIHNVDNYLKSK